MVRRGGDIYERTKTSDGAGRICICIASSDWGLTYDNRKMIDSLDKEDGGRRFSFFCWI